MGRGKPGREFMFYLSHPSSLLGLDWCCGFSPQDTLCCTRLEDPMFVSGELTAKDKAWIRPSWAKRLAQRAGSDHDRRGSTTLHYAIPRL